MRTFLVIALLVAAAVVGWLYWQKGRVGPLVVSGFVEADQIRVGSRVGGRVAEVLAKEGARVPAGEELYHIDPFDLRERLAEAQAQLAAEQAEHDRLKAGYRPEEIEQARARRDRASAVLDRLQSGPRPKEIEIAREDLKVAQANLEFASVDYQRISRLQIGEEAAKTELDQATRSFKAAGAEVAAAQQRLALLEEGTRAEEIAEARAVLAEAEQALRLIEAGFRKEDVAQAAESVAAAQARVAAIEKQLDEMTVVSPCDCVIEAIDLHPGDLVAANAPTVSLLDLTKLWVRAYVPENRLGAAQLGRTVQVTIDSFPGERFPAQITFVAQEAEFTPRNVQTPEERSKQVFRIKATFTEGVDRLRVGMAADVWLSEASSP